MKTFLVVLIFVLSLQISNVHAQFGFIEPECGIVANSSYYIENWSAGHGGGYRIYHNGQVIKQDSETMGGVTAGNLKFVNDSVGFFVVFKVGGPINIFRIVGDHTSYIGAGAGMVTGSYVLNPHIIYITTDLSPYIFKRMNFLYKFSELQPSKSLILDTLVTMDIIVNDSILGQPMCPGMTELNYRFKKGNDTVNYKIIFNIKDSLNAIAEIGSTDLMMFPNPVTDYIKLKTNLPLKNATIRLYNHLGVLKRSINTVNWSELTIYLGDLEKGLYVIEVCQDVKNSIYKIIKY